MTHVGQEYALGTTGCFGGVSCFREFGGARIHEFFKMVAVLYEFQNQRLAFGDIDEGPD